MIKLFYDYKSHLINLKLLPFVYTYTIQWEIFKDNKFCCIASYVFVDLTAASKINSSLQLAIVYNACAMIVCSRFLHSKIESLYLLDGVELIPLTWDSVQGRRNGGPQGPGPLSFQETVSYIVWYKTQDYSKWSSITLLRIFGLFRLVVLQYSRQKPILII